MGDAPCLIQSIFHPFCMVSSRKKGVSLRVSCTGPLVPPEVSGSDSSGDGVPYLDTACILNAEGGAIHFFAMNRSLDAVANTRLEAASLPGGRRLGSVASAEMVCDAATISSDASGRRLLPDPTRNNSWADREQVIKAPCGCTVGVSGAFASLTLPPLTFAAVTINLTTAERGIGSRL